MNLCKYLRVITFGRPLLKRLFFGGNPDSSDEATTVSEELFERFCFENKISFCRIPRSDKNGRKTPDYEIVIEDQYIVVEVKQFDTNPDDNKFQKQLEEDGITEVYKGKMTKRIRGKINDAMPQLKKWAKKRIPALIIIYNNIPLDTRFIMPHNILQAMYGAESINIVLPNNPSDLPYVKSVQFGGGRKVSPQHNTSLSAVVNIYEDCKQNELHANFYHNIYSANPFEPDWFRRQRVKHFSIPELDVNTFFEWSEI